MRDKCIAAEAAILGGQSCRRGDRKLIRISVEDGR